MKPTSITTQPEANVRYSPQSLKSCSLPARAESQRARRSSSRSTRLERRLLSRLVQRLGNPLFDLELWDGHREKVTESDGRMCLRVLDRSALLRVLRDPRTGFAEGYCDGSIEVEGDLLEYLRAARRHFKPPRRKQWRQLLNRISKLAPWSARLKRVRSNIHHHYDIGNEFYRLWLDERMLYTCAYYDGFDMSLEQAQVAKMDHVCRKLQLKPGETVIEAGCGWGGFALHMAEQYGVTVRAFNISHEQIAYARDAAQRAGIDHRVEFIEKDWREIDGECDAFVSIGMLEHLGVQNYRDLGNVIDRCLHGGGRGLIHTIGRNFPADLNP